MFQLAFGDARGDSRHLANPDAASQPHDPGEQGRTGSGLANMGLPPALEGAKHSAMVLTVFRICASGTSCRSGKRFPSGSASQVSRHERAVGANSQMRVVCRTIVRRPVLRKEHFAQLRQYRTRVGKPSKSRPFQQLRPFQAPAITVNEIDIHRALLKQPGKVQVAGLDAAGDMLEQEYLVERGAECAVALSVLALKVHRVGVRLRRQHRRMQRQRAA